MAAPGTLEEAARTLEILVDDLKDVSTDDLLEALAARDVPKMARLQLKKLHIAMVASSGAGAGSQQEPEGEPDPGTALARTPSQIQWLTFIDGLDDLNDALALCERIQLDPTPVLDLDAFHELMRRFAEAISSPPEKALAGWLAHLRSGAIIWVS